MSQRISHWDCKAWPVIIIVQLNQSCHIQVQCDSDTTVSITATPNEAPSLTGDIKIMFFSSSPVSCKFPLFAEFLSSAWCTLSYFWFSICVGRKYLKIMTTVPSISGSIHHSLKITSKCPLFNAWWRSDIAVSFRANPGNFSISSGSFPFIRESSFMICSIPGYGYPERSWIIHIKVKLGMYSVKALELSCSSKKRNRNILSMGSANEYPSCTLSEMFILIKSADAHSLLISLPWYWNILSVLSKLNV